MMDEQWIPHKPETWPTRFGELQSDTQFSKYLGRFDDNGPVMERWTAKAGTTVKIVMVSRFGDVGITEDLASERNYRARLTLDKLDNLRVQP